LGQSAFKLAEGKAYAIPPGASTNAGTHQGSLCQDLPPVNEYNNPTVIINLARRAHDHNWELDPITRSLLDTDFYKLLMLQFIWKHFPKTRATFTLMNRSQDVPLGEIVDVDELREQLESTRKLRLHKSELI
jgi:hypothetical protein